MDCCPNSAQVAADWNRSFLGVSRNIRKKICYWHIILLGARPRFNLTESCYDTNFVVTCGTDDSPVTTKIVLIIDQRDLSWPGQNFVQCEIRRTLKPKIVITPNLSTLTTPKVITKTTSSATHHLRLTLVSWQLSVVITTFCPLSYTNLGKTDLANERTGHVNNVIPHWLGYFGSYTENVYCEPLRGGSVWILLVECCM